MESRREKVLGIEGGGTKTDWVLMEVDGASQKPVDRGALPPANLRIIDDAALERIFRSMPAGPTRVGAFLAGCITAADHDRLRAIAQSVWPHARIEVGSDRDSGFATAFGDTDGILVIAGTGSAVTGRKAGRVERAGGWGQLLGDQGSGYSLGMQALRSVLTHYDLTGHVSHLAEDILRTLALNRLRDLIRWVADADKMSVARLAPVAFAASRRGHPEMLAAVLGGARTLAEFTAAVARRLDMERPSVRALGGLFSFEREYLDLFKGALAELLPDAKADLCEKSGAYGAAWLASQDERPILPPAAIPDADEADLAELASAPTEQPNPRSAQIDQLTTADMVEMFVSEEECVSGALRSCRDALCSAVDLITGALKGGGHLFYVGAGTSGRLGVLDASEIPPTFGAPPELIQGIIAGGVDALHRSIEKTEDHPEEGTLAMVERGVRGGDVVCGITASGRTPFVLGALGKARQIGAKTILLTANPSRRRIQPPWDVEIDLPTGPELITGSTRLKAGTATKACLNILSTCAMIRLGKVRGNLMVDVGISNTKLRDRAVRLVSQVRGLSYLEAQRELERKGWDVRSCL
ncbi:MAG TPA: N-acetylmuramic acid 6-phosphate etherase [Verrucomicrobiae bacterium]|nr:N-acetylmuramic acid 6-phosphate etherase [Verrucomicrobiae bacterium]